MRAENDMAAQPKTEMAAQPRKKTESVKRGDFWGDFPVSDTAPHLSTRDCRSIFEHVGANAQVGEIRTETHFASQQ
jgi:hypothetical protein